MHEKKRKILVTGGAGYIGSHTAKLLSKRGDEIVVLDNLSRGYKAFAKWGEFIFGDLNDRALLVELLLRYQINAVVHFAAFAYVGESVGYPGMYYDNNVSNTINLLNAMVEANVKTIVFSSTCSTYGNPLSIPISEEHPQNPISPYGKSKWMVEHILKDFDRACDLRFISLRYFNAAGADPDGEIGECHQPETHLIPNILKTVDKDKLFCVWGDDYATRDGTCIRDYIHVNDLAEAHIKALDYLFEKNESNFFNLGTGKGYSIKEIIAAVEEMVGLKISYTVKPRRQGDAPILVADSNKAKQYLSWEPKFSNLKRILETAWHWQKKCG